MKKALQNTIGLLMVSMLILALAACGTNNAGDDSAPGEDQTNEQTEENTGANEEATEDETEEADELQVTGNYVGMADNHTIEIETEDGPMAFQVPDDMKDEIEALNEGDEVTIIYEEKEYDQRVIVDIK